MWILTPTWRALRVIEHLSTGALLAAGIWLARLLGYSPPWLPRLVRWWHRRLCRALGLRVQVTGAMANDALLVANHVSWLDIPVLGAQGRIGFLSKAEVRSWPLIGWMAEVAGTLFITRGANQASETVARIRDRIRSGIPVVIFPEGTTTDGRRIQRFHSRLFAVALEGEVRVQPVALRYGNDRELDSVAPFVGDDALLPHLLRIFRHPGLTVQVVLLPPLPAMGLDRRGLAQACRHAISAIVGVPEVGQEAALTDSPAAHPGAAPTVLPVSEAG